MDTNKTYMDKKTYDGVKGDMVMLISTEIVNELRVIKAKVQRGDKPLTDIESLIQKIEGMTVENLKVIHELDKIVKEIEELKATYNIK